MAYAAQFLDRAAPLDKVQHSDVVGFSLNTNGLSSGLCIAQEHGSREVGLSVEFADGTNTTLADTSQFVGYTESGRKLTSVLLKNNGLHLDIQIDPNDIVGREHRATHQGCDRRVRSDHDSRL
jgi:malate synthase